MFGSPSPRIPVSCLTETCTTSDTSLATWYRTTQLSSAGRWRTVEARETRMRPASAAAARSALPLLRIRHLATAVQPEVIPPLQDESPLFTPPLDLAWQVLSHLVVEG